MRLREYVPADYEHVVALWVAAGLLPSRLRQVPAHQGINKEKFPTCRPVWVAARYGQLNTEPDPGSNSPL